ncbi:asparaginase [Nonomuraea turkmeniaca]|uniref:asparaginase n=1 Tax=Nonomuraea turkmeniaca TaxID=103838 RepID=A0A5S4FRR4_9ACTN|nr:asparaginase [Nonomuraea turkmeniaca]TMR23426.1 asparaginase [Nonomuraea turkmeniaca]
MMKKILAAAAAAAALVAAVPATAATSAPKPKVVVIGTGGTIAGAADSRVSFETYKPARLPTADLVKFLQPEAGRVAEVSVKEFGAQGSSEYTLAEYHDLSQLVDKQLEAADAVVVTTGTQTMEELAYWLDLTLRSTKPVVVTGSMRPWTAIGSDGPPNLYNALRLAASGRTRCFGSVVMVNDEIFAAREVTKTSTQRLNTFAAPETGRLGTIGDKGVTLLRAPARPCEKTPFDLSKISRDRLPKTEIVYAYAQAGGESVKAFADAGAKGLVFAGTPSPQQFKEAQAAAERGVALVAANRNTTGAVHAEVPGVIAAQDLLPQKARLLLTLSLATAHDLQQLQERFAKYGTPQAG